MPDYGKYRPEDMPPDAVAVPVLRKIFAHAEMTPDALAIVACAGDGGYERVTYAELRRRVTALADGLRRSGLKPGEPVGILMDNTHGYQAILTILACNLVSAVFVPLNARFVARELLDTVSRSSCVMLVMAAEFEGTIAGIRPELPKLRSIVSVGLSTAAELDFDTLLSEGDPEATDWPEVDMMSVSEIMFTSGTTATPKAVAVLHFATAASAHIFRALLELKPSDVIQSFFPVFTTACTKCVALPILSAGGTLVVDRAMDVPEIVDRMEREGTTIYYAVPAFYLFLLDLALRRSVETDRMRLFVFGGAAMPEEAIRKLRDRFPGVGLAQTLGSTETGATGSILYPEYQLEKVGSVGKAYPYTEVRLVDEDFREVPVGMPGEFAVRSSAVFNEYLDDPISTAATLRNGWVLMGDIGYRDEDGFLFHTDRKKDIIIRGGHNIGSMEVEGILYQHPDIVEAAAVGVPHKKLGEDVFVFVVRTGAGTLSEEDVIDHCRAHLADYKVPRHVAFVDAMPRNAMGKILKTTLRENAKAILSDLPSA